MALKNTVEFIFHIENHWIAVKDITLVKGSRRNRQKTFFFLNNEDLQVCF